MSRLASLVAVAAVLASCSTTDLPLAKQEPVANVPSSLVKPPWEALVQAGPGAGQDIDLETLDGPGATPVAEAPVPPNAAGDPNATAPLGSSNDDGAIRNVYVAPVFGADRGGSAALTEAMRRQLSEAGWPVLNSARKDALTIVGKLNVSAVHSGVRTIAINWTVTTPAGKVLGSLTQKNDVSAAALGNSWGETAEAATAAAADGIFELVGKAQGASN